MRISHALIAMARTAIAALYGLEKQHPATVQSPPQPPPAPCPEPPAALPRHRSPYGLPEPPCYVDGQPLVRPYLVEYERRQRRRLVMAAHHGIVVDCVVVGGGR
ncbi:hypothetical protein [Streptomyces gobiensis]|uniref:hypothetical protein n=1 Tax=Streptomyces gobiensis TaxID=2875706 RepID=UPI001E56AAA9|nr:hypothetical protein [Streptomyces gobiensis]UGY94423.1 hypothetical protein test1122_23610 [Streptomyces gobiensis]